MSDEPGGLSAVVAALREDLALPPEVRTEFERLMASLPARYTEADREFVRRAFWFAAYAHAGQTRASGEPYITHCLAVAYILAAEMHLSPIAVAAGLLHDVVEDTDITLDDLRREFGEDVARFVDGVTKMKALPRVSHTVQEGEEAEAEGETGPLDKRRRALQMERRLRTYANIRKIVIAMLSDPEVILIKLADRLHNMRTLHHLPEAKRRRIAEQTLYVFAPLAGRLGMGRVKWELEDRAFRYVNPTKYREIAAKLEARRSEREKALQYIREHLREVLYRSLTDHRYHIDIQARPKHIYSIYRKMQRKKVPFEQILDVRGVRLIVELKPRHQEGLDPDTIHRMETGMCYTLLGIIHTHWRPISGEFDDYIAVPKDNQYQSLHTTVIFDDGRPLEVQIRTRQMHEVAELGIAAHWAYKEGVQDPHDRDAMLRKIQWVRQALEWQKDVRDTLEFMDGMKRDLFPDRIYVFTPKGDIIDLPAGATPVDFAYYIHTEVGHRCRGAKVNGKLVPLNYKLKSGDQVEIITAKAGGPSMDWLNPELGYATTQRARAKIRHWLRMRQKQENLARGQDLLKRELSRLGLTDADLEALPQKLGYASVADIYVAIGRGDLDPAAVIRALAGEETQAEEDIFVPREETEEAQGDYIIQEVDGLLTRKARCCNPAPGDEIIGYVTRGRGITIHRADCPTALALKMRDPSRFIVASWGPRAREQRYAVPIRIEAIDRRGLLRDVAEIIAQTGANIVGAEVHTRDDLRAFFDMHVQVRDIAELRRILVRLETLPNIIRAFRLKTGRAAQPDGGPARTPPPRASKKRKSRGRRSKHV